MPRRRRTLSVTGLAVSALAALALSSADAIAQTPPIDTTTDLLAPLPEIGTNPTPQARRRSLGTLVAQDQLNQDQAPPTNTFTTPSRIGATPTYGSPPAFGAGGTGYDSTNTGQSKKRAPARPQPAFPNQDTPESTFDPVPTLTPPPPPAPPAPSPAVPADVHPAKAASRPGAVLPPLPETLPVSNPPAEVHPLTAANRPGATVPVPQPIDITQLNAAVAPALPKAPALAPAPPTLLPPNVLPFNMVPQRQLPLAGGDPYAPLGMRAGSFILLPSLDLAGNYSTNPQHASTTPSSAMSGVVMPELQAISDWDRHSLTADIVGSWTQYGENLVPSLNVPYFSSTVDGRVDVTHDTQIVVENRYLLNTDNPGSPNLQAQLSRLPINTDLGGTLGIAHEFNRLSFALLGTYDTAQYDNSLLTDGEQVSNVTRNFNQTAGILRLSYDLDPGLKPFVQVQEDQRTHPFDAQRNSTGTSVQVGGDVDLFGSLTGEMAGGWLIRSYDDPTMANISGFIANGQLIWQATPLTTAKLGAASEVYETTVAGASGQFTHDLNLEIDHAFLPWIIGILQTGYGTDDYVGSSLRDTRYFVSAGLTYKMTREVQLRTQVRQDWQFATQPGFTFMATSVLVGMHLQR